MNISEPCLSSGMATPGPGGGEVATLVETSHKCQYCGKLYSSSHSLRTHEKWHRGDLAHPCSHCNKKFRNPSEVRRHEMTHTGEKPHKCPQCKMKFIQKASLRDHLEKKHPPASSVMENPNVPEAVLLSCKYCQRQFTDLGELAHHEENELKEFELLHQTFEQVAFLKSPLSPRASLPLQVELQEIGNLGLQDYLSPTIENSLQDLQLRTSNVNLTPVSTSNNNLENKAPLGKQEDEEVVISQFFEELEGQYPELGKVLSDTDSSSSLSSPRHSATPVDTIPASSGWSPAATLQVEQPNFCPPTYLSSSISTDPVPVIHISQLPSDLHISNTASITYQDELNNFCEGILSQLGTSAWAEELNLGPEMPENSLPLIQEVSYQTISLPNPSLPPPSNPSSPWVGDKANLPPGWKTRMVETVVGTRPIKKAEFLSPTGQHFPSRKTAVDHMIRIGGYSAEDLECMKR